MDPLSARIAWGMFGIPQPSSHMHAVGAQRLSSSLNSSLKLFQFVAKQLYCVDES